MSGISERQKYRLATEHLDALYNFKIDKPNNPEDDNFATQSSRSDWMGHSSFASSGPTIESACQSSSDNATVTENPTDNVTDNATVTDLEELEDGDRSDELDNSFDEPATDDGADADIPNGNIFDDSVDALLASNTVEDNAELEQEGDSFVTQLSSWAVNCQINRVALSKLLKIIQTHECFKNIPIDSRTILKTPRSTKVIEMHPGNYCHFGMGNGILSALSSTSKEVLPENIELFISVDGIPLTKSSGSQFWPILGLVHQIPNSTPFAIGVYHGHSKPGSATDYLQHFVDEALTLIQHGILVNGTKKSVSIRGFICDAPARAFIAGIKGHTGYAGCGKCWIEGEYYKDRIVFDETNCRPRTDDDFAQRLQPEHHLHNSPLENLGIHMVSQFPYEYMHLVCLGVVRKIVRLWLKGKLTFRWGTLSKIECSTELVALSPYICREFARKPRDLKMMDRYKATEWRSLLMYTGIVVFRRHLPESLYVHFLTLHCAITILSSDRLTALYRSYAEQLLQYFVDMFHELYGKENVSYNVHGLVHLAKDVEMFGCLDRFSAFPFENYLQRMKNMLKKSNQPLQQLSNRLTEIKQSPAVGSGKDMHLSRSIPYLSSPDGPLQFEEFLLTKKKGDNCCILDDKSIVIIENFELRGGKTCIRAKRFKNLVDFYEKPCRSSTLGIFKASELSRSESWPVDKITQKAMQLPLNSREFVIVPLCHLH